MNKTKNTNIVQYAEIATSKFHNDPMERKWFVLSVVKINQMQTIIVKDVSLLIYILITLHAADILMRSLLKWLLVRRVDVSFERIIFYKFIFCLSNVRLLNIRLINHGSVFHN